MIVAFFALALSTIFSLVGLDNVINYGYRYMGYFATVTFIIPLLTIGRYKNKKSGVRTRLLKGAHESALFFLEDTITSVKISKVDIADGEELEGATIQLIDKDKCRGGALRL